MTRGYRVLTAVNSSVTAEAPQAVNVESDFIIILAALLCALICVVGLIAVARCTWLRRGGVGGGGATYGGRSSNKQAANKGLRKKVVEALPKYTYDSSSGKDAKLAVVTGECAICLAEYVNGDEIRVLPQCGHGFHVGCIDTWLGSHSSCPSCRQILVVARCKKCGEFPTGDQVMAEVEVKGRQQQDNASSSEYLP